MEPEHHQQGKILRRFRFISGLPKSDTTLFAWVGGRVHTCAQGSTGADGAVVYAFNARKRTGYGVQANQLLLARYENPTSDPTKVLKADYGFVVEPAPRKISSTSAATSANSNSSLERCLTYLAQQNTRRSAQSAVAADPA
ncbi:MAG: hypothetical protein ABI767_03570 [Rhodanobacter sp.]